MVAGELHELAIRIFSHACRDTGDELCKVDEPFFFKFIFRKENDDSTSFMTILHFQMMHRKFLHDEFFKIWWGPLNSKI